MAVSFELRKWVMAEMQWCYGTKPKIIAYKQIVVKNHHLLQKTPNKNTFKRLKQ